MPFRMPTMLTTLDADVIPFMIVTVKDLVSDQDPSSRRARARL